MRGVSGRAVQMLLGHESITTIELYTHLPNEFLVGIMNTLSYLRFERGLGKRCVKSVSVYANMT